MSEQGLPEGPGQRWLAGLDKDLRVAPAAQPKTPVEKLQHGLDQIQKSIRQQQMMTEQTLQGSLSQAATQAVTTQKLDQILDLAAQLVTMAQQGTEALRTNLPQARAVLDQLDTQIGNQRAQLEMEVSQSLQQAVSSMAQAQHAMFASQEFSRLALVLKQGEQAVKDLESPSLM
ncbi:MAG: hypothetical protein AB1445_00485 [Bacillota bacterium]